MSNGGNVISPHEIIEIVNVNALAVNNGAGGFFRLFFCNLFNLSNQFEELVRNRNEQ